MYYFFITPTFIEHVSFVYLFSELPLLTWSGTTHNNSSVICVHWCRSRPSVFFVLDQSSFLHTWDLSMSQSEPLSSEPITTQQSSHVTDIALSNDHAATGVGVPGRKPQMVKKK